VSESAVEIPSHPRPRAAARLRRLRTVARLRRRWGWLLLALPLVLVVAADARLRGDRLLDLSGKYLLSYAFAMLESALLWGILLFAASARRGLFRWVAAAAFVVLATCAVGGQIYFHRQYATYLNLDATLFGTSFAQSLFGQLRADGPNFLVSVLPPLVLAAVLVWIGRRVLRPPRNVRARAARAGAPVVVAAAFLVPCSYRAVQASTPDVIYFHAIGGLLQNMVGMRSDAQVRPGLRTPPEMPVLVARPTRPRNVLFILTESVRADAHCSAFAEDCPNAPQVNEAVPARIPLRQLRSNSSTTAIELAVLWSGLQPVASREALHSWPLLFDYAHAAGIESAYWTSHHMMFANSRLYVQDLPTVKQCGATDLDPLADIDLGARDDLLTERIREEIGTLREPFFAVAHYGNTHVPYRVDPDHAPFQPALESKGPEDNEAYENHYKNAVHLQDRTIADLIRAVRDSDIGARTVIVFTSDHGESFREHGQLGHTGAILDEEIHVPGWVDAPEGTLDDTERAELEAIADEPVFHTDVTPTILDLLGLLDAPELDHWTSGLVGSSWLRPLPEAPLLHLTNCSGIWGCAFRNWGVMEGSRKLEGRQWDQAWHCYDVLADPEEKRDLGLEACSDLVRAAEAVYGGPPSAP
jgi:glucan phosphoethanolaminetransferase (alkaline phosphatase superfamily)